MTKVITNGLRDLIRRHADLHSTVCSKSETSCLTSMGVSGVICSNPGLGKDIIPSTKTSSNSILLGDKCHH